MAAPDVPRSTRTHMGAGQGRTEAERITEERAAAAGRWAKAEAHKGKLIDAAVEIIRENGLSAVTLRGVGQRAGFSRGLVNYYFGTRRALLWLAVEKMVGRELSPELSEWQLTQELLGRVRR